MNVAGEILDNSIYCPDEELDTATCSFRNLIIDKLMIMGNKGNSSIIR